MKTREEILTLRDECDIRSRELFEAGEKKAAWTECCMVLAFNWVLEIDDDVNMQSNETMDSILRQGQARHAESN